jgi:hypothetical protein
MGYLVRQNRICCEVENESYFIACLLVNDLGALPCENAAASVERLTSTSKHKDFFRKATKTSRMAVIEMLLSELGIDDNENESIAFLSVDLPFGIKARINTVAIHNATRRLPDRRDVIQ